MKRQSLVVLIILIPVALIAGYFIGKSASTGKTNDKAILAFVNGEPITKKDVNVLIGSYVSQIESRIHQVESGAVNHLVEQKLWEQAAKKDNMDKEAWLESKIDKSKLEVTNAELEDIWTKQKDRIKMKKEEFMPQLKSHLALQKKNQEMQGVLAKIRSDAESAGKIKILLAEPEEEKIKLDLASAPSYGNPNANITIVEFTDYECPFCAMSQDALHKVMEHYKDNLRLVVKDFPLDRHANAKPAAIATYCVKEQNEGKFWEFRQKLFERTTNKQDLSSNAQKEIVKTLGLNVDAFNTCMQANKYAKIVDESFAQGQQVGVGGTPTFFIIYGRGKTEGHKLSVAPTFENFQKKIDALLGKK